LSRGYTWGLYESDDGNTYAWRTDADYFLMPERGWTGPAPAGTRVYPRFWHPRRVTGLDAQGNKLHAIVASTTADLWTGVATTFTVNGSDELPHVCTVIFSQQEIMRPRP